MVWPNCFLQICDLTNRVIHDGLCWVSPRPVSHPLSPCATAAGVATQVEYISSLRRQPHSPCLEPHPHVTGLPCGTRSCAGLAVTVPEFWAHVDHGLEGENL